MSALPVIPAARRGRRPPVALWLALLVSGGLAAEDRPHHVSIVAQPPKCVQPAGLPIVPNDPGTRSGAAAGDCRISVQRELALRMPREGYLWLERLTPDASAWVAVRPPVHDARGPRPAPLGLKLTRPASGWQLEARRGSAATLTPLEPGQWQEVNAPGGQRFWIILEAPMRKRISGRGD